jgi:predicted nucleic acid-binding protein
MLIVDASTLYQVLVGTSHAEAIRKRLLDDRDQVAPQLIDAEVLGIIRRHFLAGHLDRTAANEAVEDLRDWPGERFGHRALLDRAWQLRDSVRPWDAMYVALAEALQSVLITTDERLARAGGLHCAVEVVPR